MFMFMFMFFLDLCPNHIAALVSSGGKDETFFSGYRQRENFFLRVFSYSSPENVIVLSDSRILQRQHLHGHLDPYVAA